MVYSAKSILTRLPHLQTVLQGFPFDRIHNFGNHSSRVHLADVVPEKYTQSRRRVKFENVESEFDNTGNIQELFLENLTIRQSLVNENVRDNTKLLIAQKLLT